MCNNYVYWYRYIETRVIYYLHEKCKKMHLNRFLVLYVIVQNVLKLLRGIE